MRIGLFFLIGLMSVSVFCAADWPQWRGPNFNGISDQTGLPDSLDPNTVLWKTPLPGPGEATPAIANGRVYLSGYEKEAKTLLAMCVDAGTGKMLWTKTASTFDKLPNRNIIASPSPVADESGAVFLYSNGLLVRFGSEGKQQWKRDLVAEYGPFQTGWSYSSSPLLFEERLYIAVMRSPTPPDKSDYTGSMMPYLLCVDPATGKNIFKIDRPTDAEGDFTDSYATPIPAQVDGQTQILLYGGNYLTGHDPKTGAELWRYYYMDEEMRWGRAAGTPVVEGNVIYCPFPTGKKMFACELSKLAGGDTSRLWTYNQQGADVPTPVLYQGALFMIEERKKTLICLDPATGAVKWTGQLDKGDSFYASITAADGKLYTVNRKGAVTVVAADPDEFRILGSHTFDEDPVDSTIAIANGKLYLRTAENLYCFGRKDK